MPIVNDRYGIPAKEVLNLGSRFRKQKLIVGFGSFDKFLRFCAESDYKPGMYMLRYNSSEPHSPTNTFFCEVKRHPKEPMKDHKGSQNWICKGCKEKTCTRPGSGCIKYQKAFVENWNKNIHRKKPVSVDSNKPMVFRYEHPDLIREGIIFVGGTK